MEFQRGTTRTSTTAKMHYSSWGQKIAYTNSIQISIQVGGRFWKNKTLRLLPKEPKLNPS
jgi:hypothetical protein